jgi:hypothetical protein
MLINELLKIAEFGFRKAVEFGDTELDLVILVDILQFLS